MGLEIDAGPAAIREHARKLRSQSARLRGDAASKRRRADELVYQLVLTLTRCGSRALGDRGERFQLDLARLTPMVRLARHDLRRWLERFDLPAELVSEVALACSEACANAVEHSKNPTRYVMAIEGSLRASELELHVRDFGSWDDERTQSEERGRGLAMIKAVMDSVDVRHDGEGTEIVMRRSLASKKTAATR